MSFNQALKKLKALPQNERELASGVYVFAAKGGAPHCGCAIGKVLPPKIRLEIWGSRRNRRMNFNRSDVADLMEAFFPKQNSLVGMNDSDLESLQKANDNFEPSKNDKETRLKRYDFIISWLSEITNEKEKYGETFP